MHEYKAYHACAAQRKHSMTALLFPTSKERNFHDKQKEVMCKLLDFRSKLCSTQPIESYANIEFFMCVQWIKVSVIWGWIWMEQIKQPTVVLVINNQALLQAQNTPSAVKIL